MTWFLVAWGVLIFGYGRLSWKKGRSSLRQARECLDEEAGRRARETRPLHVDRSPAA